MSDGASIQLKCPLCDAAVVAPANQAGQRITCDFCLEEFSVPVPAAQAAPTPHQQPADERPRPGVAEADSSQDPAAESDLGFDLSDLDEDEELGFADERPAAPVAPTSGLGGGPDRDPPTDSSDEAWLHVDEDLTTPDDKDYSARKKVLTSDYEFSGPCPLCATRFVATDAQIGTTRRCPDCHTEFEIREPPASARQPLRRGGNAWDDDDYQLGEPDELAGIQPPSDDPLGSLDDLDMDPALPVGNSVRPLPNATSWPREQGVDGNLVLADAALRKAEEELDEQEALHTELPPNPLWNGNLSFLAEPSLLIRWLLFAIGIQVEFSALNGAIARAQIDEAIAQFLCLALSCFVVLFGVALLLGGSVTLLAITQDSASGRDKIENWPDANFMDWFLEAFHVVAALFVCVVVGMLAGQIFLPLGMTAYAWGLTLAVALATTVIFPVYLLGSLETGLAVNPFSGPVWRSLTLARGTWIQFALMSAGLAVVAILAWSLRYVESAILNFVAAVVVSGILMVYFRLLGRLAWICQEAVGDDERRREEAE